MVNKTVRELDEYRNRKLDNKDGGGGGGMSNFATHKDLEALESKINSKFDLTEQKIKVMFLEEREYHRKNKVDTIKWTVGTGIAVTGLFLTIIKFYMN
jgi:hypothetical protein